MNTWNRLNVNEREALLIDMGYSPEDAYFWRDSEWSALTGEMQARLENFD